MRNLGLVKTKKKVKKSEIPDAIKQSSEALNLQWPGEEHKLQEMFIFKNFEYLCTLKSRLLKLNQILHKEHRHGDTNLSMVVRHIIVAMNSPLRIAEYWTQEVNLLSWRWHRWDGKLMKWVLKDRHYKIDKLFCELIVDYAGTSAYWQIIRRRLFSIKG